MSVTPSNGPSTVTGIDHSPAVSDSIATAPRLVSEVYVANVALDVAGRWSATRKRSQRQPFVPPSSAPEMNVPLCAEVSESFTEMPLDEVCGQPARRPIEYALMPSPRIGG